MDRQIKPTYRYTPVVSELPHRLVTPQTNRYLGYSIRVLQQSLVDQAHNTDSRHFWVGAVLGAAYTAPDAPRYQKSYRAQRLSTEQSYSPPHYHDYLQMFYVLDGQIVHQIRGQVFVQRPGDLTVISPFGTHEILTSGQAVFVQCNLAEGFINPSMGQDGSKRMLKQLFLNPILQHTAAGQYNLTLENTDRIRAEQLFEDLIQEYHTGTTFSHGYIQLLLAELFALVLSAYDKTSRTSQPPGQQRLRMAMTRALSFIAENYTEDISRAQLCALTDMSASSFSRLFRSVVGKTFMEHLIYLRAHHAQKLLTQTDKSLVEICFSCGFSDGAHFSNTFKKLTGCTPTEYRRLYA